MAKKCPPGKYYCFTDKKCKKIPRGYHIGARGYLARGDNRSDSGNGENGNGNGSSNGNGNGGNGSGNGNGGSSGNGGGNGGGGMGESIVYETLNSKDKPFVKKLVGKLRKGSKTHAKQADDLEKAMTEESNPRIPRKKGQPANSKKHSDLYTDENPKGTIHGLGFKDVAKAKASVSKIRNSSRSHAHKIQAAVAMEQRAREMGKTSEAAVYRKYINSMKKKTKRMNEAVNAAQQAAIAIDMKKKGKKPKSVNESVLQLEVPKNNTEFKLGLMFRETLDQDTGMIFEFEQSDRHSFHMKNTSIPLDIAFVREDGTIDSIKKLDPHDPNPVYPDGKVMYAIETNRDWFANNDIEVGDIVERKMTSSEKRKDTMLKKKYDKSDMKKSMQKQYGKEEGKKVYFATIRKQAMEEIDKYNVSEEGLRDWFGKSSGTTKSGRKVRGWVQVGGKYDGKPCARQPGQKSTPKCVSSSKRRSMSKSERDSAARRKRAADPNQPQKSGAAKPTNVSTDPKRKMKKEEYLDERLFPGVASRAIRRSRAAMIMRGGSPATRPEYTVKGKPDNSLAKMKEYDKQGGRFGKPLTDMARGKYGQMSGKNIGTKIKKGFEDEASRQRAQNKARQERKLPTLGGITGKIALAASPGFAIAGIKKAIEDKPSLPKPLSRKQIDKRYPQPKFRHGVKMEETMNEAKDKKGKGSGTKDACYHKVKSRYSVWPSAYASGALVKCRKVGAANWGNKSKNEGFSPMQVAALEDAGMIEIKEGQKCWKGYEKKGTKMMFGKRYNNCVKKKSTKEEVEYTNEGVAFLKREKEKKKSSSEYLTQRDAGKLAKKKMAKKDQEKVNFLEPEETNESKTRLVKNGHTYKVVLTWRGKTYMVQMFVPSVSRPTRQQVEKEVQKIYPDAKLMSFLPRDLEPGEPTVMMGEEKRDEYGDIVGGPKISKKQKAKNLAKNEKDEQHTTTTSEEYVAEDDMKGMSVKSGHKRPTKSGAGMTQKGVEAYRRRNPGSKLKTAVTGKVKKGSKDAKRRKSYCARSAGQMKKFPKAAKDPNSRLRQARRRWKC